MAFPFHCASEPQFGAKGSDAPHAQPPQRSRPRGAGARRGAPGKVDRMTHGAIDGGGEAHRRQRARIHLRTGRGTQDRTEIRAAPEENRREPGRPGDELGQALLKAGPLREADEPDRRGEDHAEGRGEAPWRSRRRVRCGRDGPGRDGEAVGVVSAAGRGGDLGPGRIGQHGPSPSRPIRVHAMTPRALSARSCSERRSSISTRGSLRR